MIAVIRFIKPVHLGVAAEVYEHYIAGRTSIDGKRVTVDFDADERFIRFNYGGANHFDLVPFTNIASLHCVPNLNKPVEK